MELLQELNTFSSIYHEYVAACDYLTQRSQEYSQLNIAGATQWYRQSDDELIVKSREVENSISVAEKSIANDRGRMANNTRKAKWAGDNRDQEIRKVEQELQEEIKKRNRKTIIFALVWVFLIAPGVASMIVPLFGGLALIGGSAMNGNEVSESVIQGMVVIMGVVYAIVLAIGIIIYAFVQSGHKKRAEQTAKEKKLGAQEDYEKFVAAAQQNSIVQQQRINEVSRRLEALKPQAARQKRVAMEQAKLLWATEMVNRGGEIQRIAENCDQLYGQLVALGTIPSEDDWPAVDDVIDKISSGRADDLKEALQLIDADQYHRESMTMMAAQLSEQVELRKQLKVDMDNLTQQVALTRDEIRRQHSADRAQRDRQHARQMAAEAAQIAIQAANYSEQRSFHNEVRRQMQ